MKPRYSQVILYGGGRCLERFGVPFWRTSRAEDVPAVFTRTGVGAAVTSRGLREYSADRLRTAELYNAATGLWERAVVVSPLTTNDITRSSELDDAAWTKTGTTIPVTNAIGPFGEAEAARIQETAAGGTHEARQTITPNPSEENIWHGYLEPQQLTQVRLDLEGQGNTGLAIVNLTGDGSLGTVSGGGGPSAFVRRAGPSWYHCGIAVNSGSGGNGPLARIVLTDGAEGVSYSGDVANGLRAWGWQHGEQQRHLGPHLPTTSAARGMGSAEVLYAPFPRACFGLSILIDFRWGIDGYFAGLDNVFHVGGSGSTAPRLQLRVSSGEALTIDHENGVAATATASSAALTTPLHGDRLKVLVVLNPDGSVQGAHSHNGGAVATWGPSAAPASGLASEWSDARFYPFHYNGGTAQGHLFKVIGARGARTFAEMDSVLA